MKCPVCAYPNMPYPPADYNICPCCGTEFGNDDAVLSVDQLRAQWLGNGAIWFFGNPPLNWNPYLQIVRGGHPEAVPMFAREVIFQPNNTVTATTRDNRYLQPADHNLVAT